MSASIWVLGEALMDCIAQPDGSLRPLMGGSPYNMARAAGLRADEARASDGDRAGAAQGPLQSGSRGRRGGHERNRRAVRRWPLRSTGRAVERVVQWSVCPGLLLPIR